MSMRQHLDHDKHSFVDEGLNLLPLYPELGFMRDALLLREGSDLIAHGCTIGSETIAPFGCCLTAWLG